MNTRRTVALSVSILVLLGLAGAAIYLYWGQQLRGFLFYTESEEPTTISGKVTAADDGPVAGVILIELGRLYGQNYQFGGVIDENGMFSMKILSRFRPTRLKNIHRKFPKSLWIIEGGKPSSG